MNDKNESRFIYINYKDHNKTKINSEIIQLLLFQSPSFYSCYIY